MHAIIKTNISINVSVIRHSTQSFVEKGQKLPGTFLLCNRLILSCIMRYTSLTFDPCLFWHSSNILIFFYPRTSVSLLRYLSFLDSTSGHNISIFLMMILLFPSSLICIASDSLKAFAIPYFVISSMHSYLPIVFNLRTLRIFTGYILNVTVRTTILCTR